MPLSIYGLIFPFSLALGEEKHPVAACFQSNKKYGSASESLGTVKPRKRRLEEDGTHVFDDFNAGVQIQRVKKSRSERSEPRKKTDTSLQFHRSTPKPSCSPPSPSPSPPTPLFSNPAYDPTDKRHEWELQWFVCAHHAAFTASTAPCLRREILLRKKIARKHRALKEENATLRRELERLSAGLTSF